MLSFVMQLCLFFFPLVRGASCCYVVLCDAICSLLLPSRHCAWERELEALAIYMGHSLAMQKGTYDRRTKEGSWRNFKALQTLKLESRDDTLFESRDENLRA